MRKLFLSTLVLIISVSFIRADEGMWIPSLLKKLNADDMQRLGLKLTPEEIYSINNSSLKDAIVQFGRGCTGELVSAEGLLFTNHHCGYGEIQAHSTVENDYLTNGFWAKTKTEELPNPGLTVKFLVRMEDVTEKITSKLADTMTESQRITAARVASLEIEKEATEGTHYTAVVKPYFEGNEYYLSVYEIFEDVRLVGTPPNSIGKFGGDTDNWMWPRHTCDFAVFRVYMAPDGKPAKYSKDNVPYRSKHFLPISLEGVKKGDFAMTLGYPGSTKRFLTSHGVEQVIDIQAPTVVKIRGVKLDVYDKYMDADPEVRIQYASKRARISNYWKYFIGQGKQLKQNNVVEKKIAIENDFANWAASKNEYKNVITDLKDAYSAEKEAVKLRWYTFEAGFGPEIFSLALKTNGLSKLLAEKASKEDIAKAAAAIKASLPLFYKDYNEALDAYLTAYMIKLYTEDLDENLQAPALLAMVKKYKGTYSSMSDAIFAGTMFADQAKLEAFLDKPSLKTLEKDIAFTLVNDILANYLKHNNAENTAKLNKAKRLFIKGIREMNADKTYAPDANSTMRVSYGEVLDYAPYDAVSYDYITTLKGVMEKDDPKNPDFIVPEKLKDLYKYKDYGKYGDSTLVTCFLTTNDITGGNSGSPVVNDEGALIGIAFDGNWEAMSGDIYYELNLQRTIIVDIRYVLFIIEKYAGATNLIDELVFSEVTEEATEEVTEEATEEVTEEEVTEEEN